MLLTCLKMKVVNESEECKPGSEQVFVNMCFVWWVVFVFCFCLFFLEGISLCYKTTLGLLIERWLCHSCGLVPEC